MVGYRTKEFYIKKYGEIDGEQQYEKVLNRRNHKISRISSGRTTVLGDNLEKEIENGNAIRCLECGSIVTRLQWTHFRNKCTVKSIDAYKEKFPGAPIVAPNLIKMTAITLESMVELFGEEKGKQRFDEYRMKQAETNTLEYKKAKYGMTEEEFKTYNKSRSVTLENLVARHGEEEGLIKWNNYCDRQRYTTSLEYFIKTYGDDEGHRIHANFLKKRDQYPNHSSKLEDVIFRHLNEKIPNLGRQIGNCGSRGEFDFGIGSKLIEVYGTYWHADPRKYSADTKLIGGRKCAKDIWKKDQNKNKAACDLGYSVYVIWEIDWKQDPDLIRNKIIEWINDDKNSSGGSF